MNDTDSYTNLSQKEEEELNKKNSIFAKTLKQFELERKEWLNKISDLSIMFRDISKIADLQVELYTNRQIILEYKGRLASIVAKMEKERQQLKRAALDNYTNKFNFKINASERELMVDTDVIDMTERINQISNHIDFLHETMRGIDNMIYGIKYRIEAQAYRTVSIN